MPYYGYRVQGDGFLGSLFKGATRVVGGALGISRPGPVQVSIGPESIAGVLGHFGVRSGIPGRGNAKYPPTTFGPPGVGLIGGPMGVTPMGRRRRRMNPGNAKALNRAIRRINGFAGLVKRSKRAVGKANSAIGNRPRAVKKAGRR